MGSVKDIEIIKEPTKESMGIARFHFSDDIPFSIGARCPITLMGKARHYA